MTADDFLVLNFNQDLAKRIGKAKHKLLLFHFQHLKRLMELLWKMVNSTSVVEKWSWQRMKSEFKVATMWKNALATIAVAKLRGVNKQTIKETLSALGGW